MKSLIKRIKNEHHLIEITKDLFLIGMTLYGFIVLINILYCSLGIHEWSQVFYF